MVEAKDEKSGRKRRTQIWPRYHQLDVVRRLLADAGAHGAGRRYLIQHSAGSGKSNSIAWLAHQLIGLTRDDAPVFDSIIVVTDRVILDRQIRDTIRQYAQVGATVGHAERSGDLRRFIESGKKIIISTVQKFPFILDEIGNEQRGRSFAIIIDEAHSSQGGRTSAAMTQALSEAGEVGEEETYEDRINRVMESRRLLDNASYFAFTATPKNKTLEIFGTPDPQPDGTVRHHAFHSYSMKQAIQEGSSSTCSPTTRRWPATTSSPRRWRMTRSSTPAGRRRSCAATWRAATTRSASRPRSWSTTSTTRCWRRTRSAARRGRWWSPTASSARSSTTTPSATTWPSARAATRRWSPSRASTSWAERR